MDQEMLLATQQAAWAAQSAAQAAWWALAVNSAVVVVAVGTTFFQEWRVGRRTAQSKKDLHQGVIDAVILARGSIGQSAAIFHSAGRVRDDAVATMLAAVARHRHMISLYLSREVDADLLIGLLKMDEYLGRAHAVLTTAQIASSNGYAENAVFNGQLDRTAAEAELVMLTMA